MAQSRMTAKNTFGEGLIMDFAPDNTQANTLSNALNATLLTYNGNEMSLQNDMGNGRVETAFLPEGYIPVGVTEFGGIIYIVSYNPQDSLCQIGCFPSPERNITKEDRLSTDMMPAPLSADYFQEMALDEPTGKIKSLVSKVIIKEDSLNPGDKYIIESNRGVYTVEDLECISSLANDGKARRLKLSIVSVEDSGKITKLDTLNYEVNTQDSGAKNFHILTSGSIGSSETVDIDSYRQNLKQNYNVFSSKIPGKLAILAELEVISGFSCGHRVITQTSKRDGIEYTTYDVYLDYKWESEDSTINPEYITITDFQWESLLSEGVLQGKFAVVADSEGRTRELTVDTQQLVPYSEASYEGAIAPVGILDGNNMLVRLPKLVEGNTSYFSHRITKENNTTIDFNKASYKKSKYEDHKRVMIFSTEDSSNTCVIAGQDIKEVDINNTLGLTNTTYVCSITIPSQFSNYIFRLPFKLKYSVAPAMDFGILEHLTVSNEIDFSLIGTKLIQPIGLKYFVNPDFLTINIDSEIYEEENHKVTEMALEFYDINGFCGSYFFEDRESYSGNLTVNIPFNSLFLKQYKLGDSNDLPWYHDLSGDIDSAETKNVKLDSYSADTGDCGILYDNLLYGVKLIYVYDSLNVEGEILKGEGEKIERGFWLYTTGQFNDYYYSVDNFSAIQSKIPLIYSYKLKDNTYKKNVHLTQGAEEFFQNLLNASDADLNNYNEKRDPFTTVATYEGTFDLDVQLGIPENDTYNLIEYSSEFSNASLPSISFDLLSPYSEGKTYSLIEETDSSEDDEESEGTIPEYSKYEYKDSHLTINSSALSVNTKYQVKTKINMKMPDITFDTYPSEYAKKRVNATILTPILYKSEDFSNNSYNEEEGYNYEDIGGTTMFTKALCFGGSDDSESDLRDRNSDDAWYQTYISEDTYTTHDSILYEYPKGSVHTNILDGDSSLIPYYNSLGNRQPFSLFTIQPLYQDSGQNTSEEKDGYIKIPGYSGKWTHNIVGKGNLKATCSDKDSARSKFYNSSTYYPPANDDFCTILRQDRDYSGDYTPDPRDRAYLPMFITRRIAEGGYEVAMSSSGGEESKKKVHAAGEDTTISSIPYTAHTGGWIKNKFYKPYCQTLKEILTVNPDINTCEIGTFSYNEENCKNLELTSLLTASITVSEDFITSAKDLTAIHGVTFNRYIENLLNRMGPANKLLKSSDVNVSLEFDTSQLGDGNKMAITYINYTMLHEHELIDKFLNYEESGLIRYLNGVYSSDSGRFDSSWDNKIYRVDIPIQNSKFYIAYKKGDLIRVSQITPRDNKTDQNGHILPYYGIGGGKPSSNVRYDITTIQPIFYNTNMCIDDFTWDIENKKHHFYYTNDSSLKVVKAAYSYLLDDDFGAGKDILLVRPYYIGPSFLHKAK